mmetsp:Transcript_31734/g.78660  ORF Transcript_31734/g.78660 Transcript_31734/m.78660 type:complete len:324 (-) Transcript_31734:244-1215(-)
MHVCIDDYEVLLRGIGDLDLNVFHLEHGYQLLLHLLQLGVLVHDHFPVSADVFAVERGLDLLHLLPDAHKVLLELLENGDRWGRRHELEVLCCFRHFVIEPLEVIVIVDAEVEIVHEQGGTFDANHVVQHLVLVEDRLRRHQLFDELENWRVQRRCAVPNRHCLTHHHTPFVQLSDRVPRSHVGLAQLSDFLKGSTGLLAPSVSTTAITASRTVTALGCVPSVVVHASLNRVGQHLIGLLDQLEHLGGLLLHGRVRVLVGMPDECLLIVGLLDARRRRVLSDAEHHIQLFTLSAHEVVLLCKDLSAKYRPTNALAFPAPCSPP